MIDVEMQASPATAFRERVLYYWAEVFSSQLVTGQEHDELSRVVSVLFLNYRQFHFANFHEIFRLRGDASGVLFSGLLEIHTIELPKLKLDREMPAAERALVRWCRFFSTTNPEELRALTKEDPMIDRAERKLAELNADEKLRQTLLERRRREGAHRLILGAERRAGRAEGLQEGRAEGERALLRKQLVRKFGELPDGAEARLGLATEAELERWAERILTAGTLDDVMG